MTRRVTIWWLTPLSWSIRPAYARNFVLKMVSPVRFYSGCRVRTVSNRVNEKLLLSVGYEVGPDGKVR
jgi:hypothetical protein